jgi:hypothetical protein
MNARAKLIPTTFIVARGPALTAIVWAKIRLNPTSAKP